MLTLRSELYNNFFPFFHF